MEKEKMINDCVEKLLYAESLTSKLDLSNKLDIGKLQGNFINMQIAGRIRRIVHELAKSNNILVEVNEKYFNQRKS